MDQVEDLLRPVEDSHAEQSALLQAVREGVARDVAPAEAVRQPALEPGGRGCHKLRDCPHSLPELVLYPVPACRCRGLSLRPVTGSSMASARARPSSAVRKKRKRWNTASKARSVFNAGRAGCHSRDGCWQPCDPNGNPEWRFGNLLPRFWQPRDRFWQPLTRNLATLLCRVAKAASQEAESARLLRSTGCRYRPRKRSKKHTRGRGLTNPQLSTCAHVEPLHLDSVASAVWTDDADGLELEQRSRQDEEVLPKVDVEDVLVRFPVSGALVSMWAISTAVSKICIGTRPSLLEEESLCVSVVP